MIIPAVFLVLGVFCAQSMCDFYATKGIQHKLSAPYSQFMDHTAERKTLIHANLPRRAWGWAAMHAIEVLNRTCESKNINLVANAKPGKVEEV